MNKQEILTAIRKTIKGQGSAVDVGGKLANILESIVDLLPEEEDFIPEIPRIGDGDDYGELTLEQLYELQKYSAVRYKGEVLQNVVGCLNMMVITSEQPTLSNILFNIMDNYGLSPGIRNVFGYINYSGEENGIMGYTILAFNEEGKYVYTEV